MILQEQEIPPHSLSHAVSVYRRKLEAREPARIKEVADRFGCAPKLAHDANRIAAKDFASENRDKGVWFDRFRFERPLGVGGFGRAGLYKDTKLGRSVTIKLPKSLLETDLKGQAIDEVRDCYNVSSTGVIAVHDVRSSLGRLH